MGTSKKQKKRDGLRYREFVLSPYGVIKIKSLGYTRKGGRKFWASLGSKATSDSVTELQVLLCVVSAVRSRPGQSPAF